MMCDVFRLCVATTLIAAVTACGPSSGASGAGGGSAGRGGAGGSAGGATGGRDGGSGGTMTGGSNTGGSTGGNSGSGGRGTESPDAGAAGNGAGHVDGSAQGGSSGNDDARANVDQKGSAATRLKWNAYLPLASGTSTGGTTGTTPDVSGHGYDAIYGTKVSFSNSALLFSGAGEVSIPAKSNTPAVEVTGSYSISVWVTLTDTNGWQTFVSADGTTVSSFYLQKHRDTGCFGFALTPEDSNNGAGHPCTASSSVAAEAGVLYHLVATRDAATGKDKLYVDGVEAGSATCLASTGMGWASKTIGIGHGMYDGKHTDNVWGFVSGLGLINRVLSAAEVADLYALGPN